MGGQEIFQPIIRVLVYVGCSGGLGGIVYSILGFSKHIIQHDFDLSYRWWFFYRPLTAAIMGVFVFFFIVGGLIGLGVPLQNSSQTASFTQNYSIANGFTVTSIMFFCALSFLAGFSSNEFIAKLEDLAKTIFTPLPKASEGQPASPAFTAKREGDKIEIRLENMGGAKSVKGLRVISPEMDKDKADLAPPGSVIKNDQTFQIPAPGQGNQAHLVVTSTVNGIPNIVVLDKTV